MVDIYRKWATFWSSGSSEFNVGLGLLKRKACLKKCSLVGHMSISLLLSPTIAVKTLFCTKQLSLFITNFSYFSLVARIVNSWLILHCCHHYHSLALVLITLLVRENLPMFEHSVRVHEDSDTIVITVGPQLEHKDFVL